MVIKLSMFLVTASDSAVSKNVGRYEAKEAYIKNKKGRALSPVKMGVVFSNSVIVIYI